MGEIRHQHIQAPLAAGISPLAISRSTLINNNTMSITTKLFSFISWEDDERCNVFFNETVVAGDYQGRVKKKKMVL